MEIFLEEATSHSIEISWKLNEQVNFIEVIDSSTRRHQNYCIILC